MTVIIIHYKMGEFFHGPVGRVLDFGSKGCKLETQSQQSHYVVSLSKTLYPLLVLVQPKKIGYRLDMIEDMIEFFLTGT